MQLDSEENNAFNAEKSSPVPVSSSQFTSLNVLEPEKEFILCFEKIPELWDSSNPHYTNKYKRNANLAKLLVILRRIKPAATIHDVKRKINTIRSNYRRELRKIEASRKYASSLDEVYTPKIWYFPYLHFLNKLEDTVTVYQNEDISEQESNDPLTIENTESEITSENSTPVKMVKAKQSNRDHNLEGACQYLAESIYNLDNNDSIPNMYSNIPIALDWANTLDRLDPTQRLYAKKAINDVLFEAELGNLRKDSVKINEGYNSAPVMNSAPP